MTDYPTIAFLIAPDALSGTALVELARLDRIVDVYLDTLKPVDGGIYLEGECPAGKWGMVEAFCKAAKAITIDYGTMAEWGYTDEVWGWLRALCDGSLIRPRPERSADPDDVREWNP